MSTEENDQFKSLIDANGDESAPPSTVIGWDKIDNAVLTVGFAEKVADAAVKRFEEVVGSHSFQTMAEKIHSSNSLSSSDSGVPTLRHSQVEVGRLLGHGGMSSVYSVVKIKSDEDFGQEESTRSEGGSSKRASAKSRGPRSVVKFMKKEAFDNASTIPVCAADLAKEAEFLALIDHPHILNIQAYAAGGLSNLASTGRNDSFFVMLDALSETLDDRIIRWKSRAAGSSFLIGRRKKHKRQDLFLERLETAAQLADAVAYLHEHRIIHRDIKPKNAGFDNHDVVKLFDMDTCRVLPADSDINKDDFQLTMRVGTLRYVSPECYLGGRYNAKTDSFSFAMMLHELLSMKHPFGKINSSILINRVFSDGLRPKISRSWPRPLQKLLACSWSEKVSDRMSMSEIRDTLMDEVERAKVAQEIRNSTPSSFCSCTHTAPVAVEPQGEAT